LLSINESLGRLHGGRVRAWSDDEVAKHIRDCYVQDSSETKRQEMARDRLDLFHDRGTRLLNAQADKIFRNTKVRQWRKKFVELAQFQNITRRIVREVSAVYSEPATRQVNSRQDAYDDLQRATQQDRKFRRLNQYVNLLNECFLWFDVDPVTLAPKIRLVTPDCFWAVCSPVDPTELIAMVIRQEPASKTPNRTDPHFLVLCHGEYFRLDADGRLVGGSRQATGIDGLPGILVHKQLPEERLLDPYTGHDLIAAHLSIALINTMLLKQQKSGTKQAVAQGDAAEMASDQPMDEEHLLQVPDGVALSVLDMGADPKHYTEAARFVTKSIAANWGMPESVFDLSYQATSGFEIELKRTALREIRRDQVLDLRPVEHEFAGIQSETLTAANHDLAFPSNGWRIDFGELETPQDPMQRLLYWEKQRKMGLMSTIDMIMSENRELTREQAIGKLIDNTEDEAKRVELMRSLNIDTSATAENPGMSPGENGAGEGENLSAIAKEVLDGP